MYQSGLFTCLMLMLLLLKDAQNTDARYARQPLSNRRVARSYCPPGSYWDGVETVCVYCKDICAPEFSAEYCKINCPEYAREVLANSVMTPALFVDINTMKTTSAVRMLATSAADRTADPPESQQLLYHATFYAILAAALGLVVIVLLVIVCSVVACFRGARSRTEKSSSIQRVDDEGCKKLTDEQSLVSFDDTKQCEYFGLSKSFDGTWSGSPTERKAMLLSLDEGGQSSHIQITLKLQHEQPFNGPAATPSSHVDDVEQFMLTDGVEEQ